jgi:hypothetical protein
LADWFLYLKSIPRAQLTHRPDDGRSKDLWNVGKLLPDYTALQPRRQPSSNSPPWELHILLNCFSPRRDTSPVHGESVTSAMCWFATGLQIR